MSEYLPNDISRYCFIDTETLSGADLKASGAYVYSEDPAFRVMIVTYAIGDGPVQVWMQDQGHAGEWLDWNDAPDDLLAHLERVEAGDAWFVAWNAAFDRLALSRGIRGYSGAQPEHFLDAMAQAVRSHLPPDLAGAGAMVGAPIQKRASGRKLIKKFCIEMASPGSDPEAWQEFVAYALDDIPPMRTVWQATLALPLSEWRTYWATERINDRGISMDVPFAVRASQLADEVYARADAEIHLATGGEVTRVTQSARLLQWALRQAADLPEVAGILTREMEQTGEVDEDDAPVTVATYSMGRAHVEALIAYLERLEVTDGLTDAHAALLRAMEVRLWGASSTPRKFTSALNSNSGGRLRGQFVFNGAPATGRWSSRQVQVQNLSRSTVGDTGAECDAIDLICALGADAYAPLRERFGPVGRTLSRLIRPLFVPPDGRRLATCDWSAIEARVLPWLAGDSVGAGGLLDVFAATDRGVTKHDVYVMTAAGILGIEPGEVSKAQRQSHGKVPCIAEGQLVLTDSGLVPIEKVSIDTRVWDGVMFVSHQGTVLKGVKDVWEYQGLIATADHIVWTEEIGPCEFLRAARSGYNLLKSGNGRAPIRVGEGDQSGEGVHQTKLAGVLCADGVHRVRRDFVAELQQLIAGFVEGVPGVLPTETGTEMVGSAADGSQAALHQPERAELGELRRAGGRVSVRLSARGVSVGDGQPWSGSRHGDRPRRQQRPLRGREFETCLAATAELEQAHECATRVGVQAGRVAIRAADGAQQNTVGHDAGGHLGGRPRGGQDEAKSLAVYRGKARVYDIVNAGPRHRFTVSDCLVHNCLALGFAGGSGALHAMATAYGAHFTDEEAADIVSGWRKTNAWAVDFWAALWTAVEAAMASPGVAFHAGRVTIAVEAGYMGRTLVIVLPSGRLLLYPKLRYEDIERRDIKTGALETRRGVLTYRRGRGRAVLHKGTVAENVTQATAACLLRAVVPLIEADPLLDPVMLVHDEVVCEVDEGVAEEATAALLGHMLRAPSWAAGLPLNAEAEHAPYYSKTF